MGKTSAAVKNRYAAKAYDRLQIIVKKGRKAEIQAAAEKQGESLNAYVAEAVRRRMESESNQ
ncbi:MAG: antitoxin [Ruminococcus sp.]|nr:antitoxin [Ruminococcus sp.]MDE5577238.1 antitoxin [Oscillospiraceae bacterium]